MGGSRAGGRGGRGRWRVAAEAGEGGAVAAAAGEGGAVALLEREIGGGIGDRGGWRTSGRGWASFFLLRIREFGDNSIAPI